MALSLPKPQKTIKEYLDQYAAEHTRLGTKLTHAIGIPMILASIPAMVVPPVGAALFAGGWFWQLVGHAVFERNKPAFLNDPYYLAIGPLWLAIEAAQAVGLPVPYTPSALHESAHG
jgi:uncharacterized membrane protein YGL010W